ncbi:unnamed protein product, partial [Symbiodinium natans]
VQRPRTSHTGPPHLALPLPAWAAGRVQKLLVVRSLVACGCGHAFLRNHISMGTAPALRRALVPTGSRTRRRGGATCRKAGCPAVRVGGSRGIRGRHPCKLCTGADPGGIARGVRRPRRCSRGRSAF